MTEVVINTKALLVVGIQQVSGDPGIEGANWRLTCLVPRPQYYASVARFGSRGPGRKCGLGKNLKSETICLTFSPSRFRLAGGNSLSVSGRGTASEVHFKLLAFGLMLIGQVKRSIWIQTHIY